MILYVLAQRPLNKFLFSRADAAEYNFSYQILRRPEPDALPQTVLQRRQLHMRPDGSSLQGVSVQDTALPSRRAGPPGTGLAQVALAVAQHKTHSR